MAADYYADSCTLTMPKSGYGIHPFAVKKIFFAISGLLLLTASSGMAMSLGRLNGAMLIGRPLDMSVQAVLDAQEDASSACLEADVFYGDSKLDKSRVRVTLEKSASTSQQALVRIRSAVLVDEPVVTLFLRVGCQQKTERRYVSLAELVSESVPDRNVPAPMPQVSPARSAPLPAIDATGGMTGNATRSAVSVDALSAAPTQTPTLARKPRNQRAPVATLDAKAVAPAKARLKLEPLDLTIDRDPQLKVSTDLLSSPAVNPQERAAASALWRALSAQPQDILRDAEKLQSLENSVRGLQVQSQKTLASIDDLNVKLEQAKTERYANVLVDALIFLLLLALAGLAYLLRRRVIGQGGDTDEKPWWRKNDSHKKNKDAWHDSSPVDVPYESGAARFATAQKPVLVDIEVESGTYPAARSIEASRAGTPNFVDSIPFDPKDKPSFGPSLMHPSRAAKAEELFDVQQQADFFVSIGQHEQAIELLRSHLAEQHETSALVYLDLFNLYHQLNRPTEYDALRLEFNDRFNTEVPSFAVYTDKNLGLESYPLALSRIEALWPTRKVLEIIEESLFRQPDTKAEAFNLEAYRELLLLYSMAKEITSQELVADEPAIEFELPNDPFERGHVHSVRFKSTAIQPLSASVELNQQVDQDLGSPTLTASAVPRASTRLGLDIDLDSLSFESHDAAGAKTGDFSPLVRDSGEHLPSNQLAANAGNLIDFDIFDMLPVVSQKPKRPGP